MSAAAFRRRRAAYRLSTDKAAGRALIQTTFGVIPSEMTQAKTMGLAGWIEHQFGLPRYDSYYTYAVTRLGPKEGGTTASALAAAHKAIWAATIEGTDQLRQRMTWALAQLFVISTVGSQLQNFAQHPLASYWDMLADNAFGNFRTLLEAVSKHWAMGMYLSHIRNRKENPTTGAMPDENYAREVMQLFSIGLVQLNQDGTPVLYTAGHPAAIADPTLVGTPIPTYGQDDIRGMARVFTGWGSGGTDQSGGVINTDGEYDSQTYYGSYASLPMAMYEPAHETGAKSFLGVTIPAGTTGQASLTIALDTLFNHSSCPPFISRFFIQRFVCSNPSPAYVKRVAAVFIDNGQGVRGDLKAVLRAVLLDQEARVEQTGPYGGRLIEPVIQRANLIRSFGRPDKTQADDYTFYFDGPTEHAGQEVLQSPSVFNYYRPDYSPPGPVLEGGMVAPEFQILSSATAIAAQNKLMWLMYRFNAAGNVEANADIRALAVGNDQGLVDYLDTYVFGGCLSTATKNTMKTAITGRPTTFDYERYKKIALATIIGWQSPEAQVRI